MRKTIGHYLFKLLERLKKENHNNYIGGHMTKCGKSVGVKLDYYL